MANAILTTMTWRLNHDRARAWLRQIVKYEGAVYHQRGKWFEARSLACVVMWACIGGCALIYQGHNIDENALKSIQPGVTTEEALVRLLGSPETIIKKHLEGITVYQYKSVRILSMGIPFPVSIGRLTQNGRVLNIIVKSGKVMDYEDNQMKERFFWRDKTE